MLPTYCPSCRAIRQPNGTFCHMCGYSFLTKEAAIATGPTTAVARSGPHLTASDGFRFGLGFMAAAFVGTLVGFVAWIVVFGAILSAIFGSLGR